MPGRRDFRDASWPVNDDGAEIIDIGRGRSRRQEIAKPREKPRGIVVSEKGGRIEAKALRAGDRGRLDYGARRIIRTAAAAVGAVCVAGERRDARRAGQRTGKRQRIFLVRSAAALPAQRHGELAARQDDGAPARRLDLACEPRMRGRDAARLALDPVAEEDRLETGGRDLGLYR